MFWRNKKLWSFLCFFLSKLLTKIKNQALRIILLLNLSKDKKGIIVVNKLPLVLANGLYLLNYFDLSPNKSSETKRIVTNLWRYFYEVLAKKTKFGFSHINHFLGTIVPSYLYFNPLAKTLNQKKLCETLHNKPTLCYTHSQQGRTLKWQK